MVTTVGGNNYVPTTGTTQTSSTDVESLQQASKVYEEIQAMVAQLGSGQTDGGDDGVTDSRGAPSISEPSKDFNSADLLDMLRNLRTKSQDKQLETAQRGLENARVKAEKNTEDQLNKIKEWVDKCKEQESKSLASKIFGWIGKIVAAIAAIASVVVAAMATVATGGAAAPLLAVAIIGAVGATMSLADQISKEAGGPEISLSNLLNTVVGKVLEACGVPKDQIENISKVVTGAIGLITLAVLVEPQMLGNMAQGIAKLAGADDATAGYIGMAVGIAAAVTVGIALAVASGGAGMGQAAQEAMKSIGPAFKLANAVIGSVSGITQGVTGATQGGLNIAIAVNQKDADKALADKKELEAIMIKLQKQMDEGEQELKKIIQEIQDSIQAVSKMLAGATDSMQQITSNIGKRAPV